MSLTGPIGLIADVPIAALGLSKATWQVLRQEGVRCIDDLARLGLIDSERIAPTATKELKRALRQLYERARHTDERSALDLRTQVAVPDPEAPTPELVRAIVRAVAEASSDERGLQVLERRYGLRDGEQYTLDEIGAYLGVTRERTRQLEARFRDRVIGVLAWLEGPSEYVLPAEAAETLRQRREALSTSDPATLAERACHDALIGPEKPLAPGDEGALALLLESWEWTRFTDSGTRFWAFGMSREELEELTSVMRSVRSLLNSAGETLDFFKIMVTVAREHGNSINNERVRQALTLLPDVEALDGERYRIRLEGLSSMAHMARRVLEEEGKPLHFREIARRINTAAVAAGQPAPVDSMEAFGSQLSMRDWFKPIGRSGEWALVEWDHVRPDTRSDLIKEALHARGRGSSIEDILTHVQTVRPEVTRESVQGLLNSRTDLFCRTGRGLYGLATWGSQQARPAKRTAPSMAARVREAAGSLVSSGRSLEFPSRVFVEELARTAELPPQRVRQVLSQAKWVRVSQRDGVGRIYTIDPEELGPAIRRHGASAPVTSRITEAVHVFLGKQPERQALLADTWKHVCRTLRVKRPTVYKALDNMEGVVKLKLEGRVYCVLDDATAGRDRNVP